MNASAFPIPSEELVLLLDAGGSIIGSQSKRTVHHDKTPLHLAFSCYIFAKNQVLVTRRSLAKSVFPGVWTNSCCGHPAPGESLRSAVRRRAFAELGIEIENIRLVIPNFEYSASHGGIWENERCPVLFADVSSNSVVCPDPQEVDDWEWVDWNIFRHQVLVGGFDVSPWCRKQICELEDADNSGTPGIDSLPPAAFL